eukprot:GCRY01003419.1.p1 GENE.GCRY01003419.1~~GCRY01003419.1.p1  ORF type:complete len:247 (+),score=16.50 GCRY01003419.1:184-924(+)
MQDGVNPLENLVNWYTNIPVITRGYFSLSILTTLACHAELINPYTLYYSFPLVFWSFQWWRIFTCFLFFGFINLHFIFHMIFLLRYSANSEEGFFRNKPADFFFMYLFGAIVILVIATAFKLEMYFMGFALTFFLLYIWARRNPFIRMQIFGVTFQSPYLPYVILLFSLLAGVATADIVGLIAGHLYYYLEDVYPKYNRGKRPLKTPRFLCRLFQQPLEGEETQDLGNTDVMGEGEEEEERVEKND